MSFQDPISDMLTIIRNGQISNKKNVIVYFSKLKNSILDVLKYNNFISDTNIKKINNNKFIEIYLKYINNIPYINKLKRISKPSLRIFSKNKDINKFKIEYGFLVVSTSKGIMLDTDLRKNNLGGEIMFFIS
ncbi:30S ribosomal protein S8 [endosymbiont of Pachyrhynchus infernalis]|uniref:30S ribosomal protein S8 n=1 Tax=endosymbiont of Pachyrhynchus infernalis TaxID=1971488 RepID=UPI000DC70F66|nr:30S ribosomal protein S8 [endosymbiont of Pachyrhynchus infernalis]BBA84846.1 30S ribosomal protein S8 [endosymbiont of Pachyrhynchus infernalis]